MKFNKILLTGLIAALVGVGLIAPRSTLAESSFCTGTGCSTSASVNFQVVIPRFLVLRIGTAGATQDTINFAPSAGVVGDGNPVSGTGGDATGGAVNTRVLSNGGNVTLSTALTNSASGLINGANFIAWGEIDTAAAGSMTAPTLQNGGVTNEVYPATGSIVNLTDTWTYTYANTTVPAVGTYTGTATYTAAIP
ncbi:MAG: hypothetical protein ACE5H7_13875 [Acidiferrobacterales bacterium]